MIGLFIRRTATKANHVINYAYDKHRLLMNIVMAGNLMALGDVIVQARCIQQGHADSHDWNRTRTLGFTAMAGAPPRHYFYQWLNFAYPERDFRTICVKLWIDEVCFSPWCIILFLAIAGSIEGKSYDEIHMEILDKYAYLYKADLGLWPPLQWLNFRYVPIKFQILIMNVITVIYNTFCSFAKYSDSVRC